MFLLEKHWVVGILIALIGCLIARYFSEMLNRELYKNIILGIGYFICTLGLFIIARGVYKKHNLNEN